VDQGDRSTNCLSKCSFAWDPLLCGDKSGAFKHRKAVCFWIGFILILTYGCYFWVMTLFCYLKYEWKIRDFYRVHSVTLHFTVEKLAKSSILNHFLKHIEISCVGLTMCPECHGRVWQSNTCWLHLQEISPEVSQGPGGVTNSQPCLVLSSGEISRTIWNCCWL